MPAPTPAPLPPAENTSADTGPAPSDALAARYGRNAGPRNRWPLILVAAGLALAGVGYLAWVALDHPAAQIDWQELRSDSSGDPVTLQFQVTRPPDTTVTCTVQAQNVSHAVVGMADIRIPASPERTTQVSVRIPVAEPAVAVMVSSCVATSDGAGLLG